MIDPQQELWAKNLAKSYLGPAAEFDFLEWSCAVEFFNVPVEASETNFFDERYVSQLSGSVLELAIISLLPRCSICGSDHLYVSPTMVTCSGCAWGGCQGCEDCGGGDPHSSEQGRNLFAAATRWHQVHSGKHSTKPTFFIGCSW